MKGLPPCPANVSQWFWNRYGGQDIFRACHAFVCDVKNGAYK